MMMERVFGRFSWELRNLEKSGKLHLFMIRNVNISILLPRIGIGIEIGMGFPILDYYIVGYSLCFL